MLERAGKVLSVAALVRAVGMPQATFHHRHRRRVDLTAEQSDAFVRVLRSAGLRLVPDHAVTDVAPPDGPPAVTLATLQRATPFVALSALSVQIGRSSTVLRGRVRTRKTEITEAEARAIADALARAGVEIIPDSAVTAATRARWAAQASLARLRAGEAQHWTPSDIRALRLRLGLTFRAMSDAMGYQDSHSVIKLERGEISPSRLACRVLDYLDACGVLPLGDGGQSP